MRILLLAVSCFLANLVLAATYYVDPVSGDDGNAGTSSSAPFKTIQKAMDTASSSSTIVLADGTYLLNDVITQKQTYITMYSASGNRDACIVDGQNQCACIYTGKNGLTLRGITFQNGLSTSTNAYASGGIGYGMNSGTLTVSNCVIRNCRRVTSSKIDLYSSSKLTGQPIRGGGICAWCATTGPLIVDTIVEDCHVVAHQDADNDKMCSVLGGGIYAYRGGRFIDLMVRNCSVSNNTATANPELAACGGGLAVLSGALIDSCIVSNCHAYGGEKFTGSLRGLILNSFSPSGGGIFIQSSATMVTNTLVSGCSAHRMGGGILISDGTVVGCTVRGNQLCPAFTNSSYMGGGGIGVYKGTTKAVIRNCLVEDNFVTNAANVVVGGGGVLLRGNSMMNDTVIRNNVADRYGGLRLDYSTNIAVSNCVIAGNIATNFAAGIGVTATATNILFDTLLVVSNRHTHNASAGCFYFTGRKSYPLVQYVIRNSAFIGNQSGSSSSGWLGEIPIPSTAVGTGKYLTFDHCTFAGNRTSYNRDKSAIYFNGTATARNTRFIGCTFADNRNPQGIGGFYAATSAGEPKLEYCFCDFDTHVTFTEDNHNVDGRELSLASVFEDAANGNFRPAEDSPLIDAGGPFAEWMGGADDGVLDAGNGWYSTKPLGDWGVTVELTKARKRCNGTASDIGAFEYWRRPGTIFHFY